MRRSLLTLLGTLIVVCGLAFTGTASAEGCSEPPPPVSKPNA